MSASPAGLSDRCPSAIAQRMIAAIRCRSWRATAGLSAQIGVNTRSTSPDVTSAIGLCPMTGSACLREDRHRPSVEAPGFQQKPPLPAQQPERLTGVTALTDSQTADVLSRFLESHSHLVSNAGIQLSTLINDDEPDPSHIEVAADLWQALLASQAADSTQGFGSLSGVTALDTDRWARLTLTTIARTGGRIDRADRVANRAMSQPPTTTTLEILNQLIRGQLKPWDLRYIADHIANYLSTATDPTSTDEYQRLRTTLIGRGMIDD